MSKTIEIIVTPKGETGVETKGFAGPECREASKSLEAALGATIDETLTADFHQVGQRSEQDRLRT